MKRYYLAYGSNLNIEQMKRRCPTAKVIGTAVIDDYKLLFKGSKSGSYLTIEPKNGSHIPVAVWEVSAADEAALDYYEGFPTFYYKKDFKVQCRYSTSGIERQVTAFAYIMHEDRPHGIPSPYYVRACMEGYREFGFDTGVLLAAVDNSRRLSR